MSLFKLVVLLKFFLFITINIYSQSITNIMPLKSENSKVNIRLVHDNLMKSFYRTTSNNVGIIDSIITKSTDGSKDKKNTYEYDENGNLIFILYQKWSGTYWVNVAQVLNAYDEYSNLVSYLSQGWSVSNSNWINSWKSTYEYNAEEQLVLEIKERWENGKWENHYQIVYEYGTDENIAVKYYYWWNDAEWLQISRLSYIYDINGNMLAEIEDHWNGEEWIFASGDRYYMWSYDSNGNLISDSMKYWDESEWHFHNKNIYSYDSNGKIVMELNKLFVDQGFVDYQRGTYTYDNNNNLTFGLFERWGDEQWINYINTTYTYNPDGNVSGGKSEKWDGLEWVNGYYYLEFFDAAGRFYSFNTSEISVFYDETTDLENVSYENAQFKLMQNYPNPFNPSTTISYSLPQSGFVQLNVYDMLGREVASLVSKEQAIGNYQVEFNALYLSSGIYFYKLKSGNFVDTKKLILLR